MLTPHIDPIERVVPARLLVPGPLCVIEVCLCLWLKIVTLGQWVLICWCIKCLSLVYLVFNIIGLSGDWIRKHFIGFDNFLEMFFSRGFPCLRCLMLKVRMEKFRFLVVGEFDSFLSDCGFYFKDLVKSLFFFAYVEDEATCWKLSICEPWRMPVQPSSQMICGWALFNL